MALQEHDDEAIQRVPELVREALALDGEIEHATERYREMTQCVVLRLPAMPEWLSPLVGIVPAQLFCFHLARAMGRDPEAPRGLSKVTRTW